MNKQKGLLIKLMETVEEHRAERRGTAQESGRAEVPGWPDWLRWQLALNIGTVLVVVILLLTVPSLAAPLHAPSATSTSTISYQGRLADSAGNPLTDKYNMEFRIYDVPAGGTPLWTEMWTGANAVDVSDGLFNVMLGSIDNTLASSIEGHDELYLGITVGTDSEMVPRVQLGSVPFSMQAMTVPDGSVTTDKIADKAVTQAKLGLDVSVEPPAGSITTEKIADRAVTDLWHAAPLYSATIPGNTDWSDVGGMSLIFSLTTSAKVFSTYSMNVEPTGNPGSDGVATRLAVDGQLASTRGTASLFQPFTSGDSNANVAGNIVLNLGPGEHTIKLQWKSYGGTSWSSNPASHDGYAQGRTLTVIAFYR
jgi:hypothetical protein